MNYKYKWDLRSSGMLRSIDWYLVTDVSGQPIGPIFRGQAVQDCISVTWLITFGGGGGDNRPWVHGYYRWSNPYRPWGFQRLPDFKTIGTLSWQGCQPYAPAAFTPHKIFLVFIDVRSGSKGISNFNLQRSQARKCGKIGFNQSLIYIHPFPPLYPQFLICPSSTQ
jgi:hypothetical protein